MKREQRFRFTHRSQVYTVVYESGFAPMWAIYKGTCARGSAYVTGYKAWGETMLPSGVQARFTATH